MTLQEALEFTGLNKRQLCLKLGVKAQNATWWHLRGRVPEKHVQGILSLGSHIELEQTTVKVSDLPDDAVVK